MLETGAIILICVFGGIISLFAIPIGCEKLYKYLFKRNEPPTKKPPLYQVTTKAIMQTFTFSFLYRKVYKSLLPFLPFPKPEASHHRIFCDTFF